ncbi:DEAD/DEAH box helicase [Oceanobacillus oncorhynchi]|uniref:DEAD/DEAH box helicase n=1 Tax=Oceanobacillus oncorhynchi TaxID=545501 RepID=UPI0034D541EA
MDIQLTEKKKAKIIMDYDFERFNKIKNVDGSEYDFINNAWILSAKYIKALVKELGQDNSEIIQMLNKANINSKEIQSDNTDSSTIKTVRIQVVKNNAKSLVINFDYDKKVLSTIKMLEKNNRTFNAKTKMWRINKAEVAWLYDKLNNLGYIDLKELEPFAEDGGLVEELDLNSFPNMTIVPKDYQVEVANLKINNKKMINALEAGLGKTLITVLAMEHIQKKTLIICLASNKYAWRDELQKVNPYADISVIDGKSGWTTSNYVILNYDILNKYKEEIEASCFDVVVIDEAHKIRGVNDKGNPSSIRAKLTLNICKRAEYVFPITATPFVNRTKDIFNILSSINHPITKNWYIFANTYCVGDYTGFGISYDGSENQEQLTEKLYPKYMVRMLTEDKIDLPERIRSFVPVKINLKKYNKRVNDYLQNRAKFDTKSQHLVEMTAMRKELAIEKSKHAVEMVKNLLDQNKSVAIFTNYRSIVEALEKKFEDNCVIVQGGISDKEKHKRVESFQSGEKKVFIGNMEAAGEAITLTKASEMIVTDMHWSPIIMTKQVEKRLHRLTQTNTVNIRYLYSEEAKLDKLMIESLNKKLSDSSMILDGKKEEFFVENLSNMLE